MSSTNTPSGDTSSASSRPRHANVHVPGFKVMPPFARRLLRRKILTVLSHEGQSPDYDTPPGDPGLFGPDSVIWKIHADFPGMMAGGLAALMLQTLHPLALAGVWDYSDFRADMLGRLRRTIAFVSRTTHAPQPKKPCSVSGASTITCGAWRPTDAPIAPTTRIC